MPVVHDLEPRKTSAWKRVSRFATINAARLAAGLRGPEYDHPKTFDEFYAREPKLVTNWLLGRGCPYDLVADYTQELLLFLMRPVTSKAGVRYQDHIAYYQPELMGNFRTRPAFLHHIFGMLTTEYPKMIKRYKRGMASGPNFVSLSAEGCGTSLVGSSLRAPVIAASEFEVVLQPLMTPNDVAALQTEDVVSEPQLILDSFFSYLEDVAEPDVLAYARACLVYSTSVDISRAMGFSRNQCRSLALSMAYWAKRFRSGRR